jgi:hypothetical protein
MFSGSGAARSSTKSQEPASQTWSISSSHTARTWASSSRTRRGVKPALTSRRRRTCSGASKSIIIGIAGNFGRTPPALEKVAVSVPAAFTSS